MKIESEIQEQRVVALQLWRVLLLEDLHMDCVRDPLAAYYTRNDFEMYYSASYQSIQVGCGTDMRNGQKIRQPLKEFHTGQRIACDCVKSGLKSYRRRMFHKLVAPPVTAITTIFQ